MTFTVDLTTEQEMVLQQKAHARNVDAEVIFRDIVDAALSADQPTSRKNPGKRIMGLHAGSLLHIADDFDDELPDSFWLGED